MKCFGRKKDLSFSLLIKHLIKKAPVLGNATQRGQWKRNKKSIKVTDELSSRELIKFKRR